MAGFWEKSFIGMHANIYRWSGGRIGGAFGGTPVLLLTTSGRKTGREHTTPLGYFTDGGDYIVVASNGGRPQRPAWYYNLSQYPRVTIRVKDQVVPVVASTVPAEEQAALWSRIATVSPAYAPYAEPVRGIPLVRLRPAA